MNMPCELRHRLLTLILAEPSARADWTSEHSTRSSCSLSARLPEYSACMHASATLSCECNTCHDIENAIWLA